MPAELHSIYDLTTFCRKTTGDVPAKLVVRVLLVFLTALQQSVLPGCIHHRRGLQDVPLRESAPQQPTT
jgi:hypothetical protein